MWVAKQITGRRLALGLLLSSCGGAADTTSVQEPSGWLEPCTSDAGCGVGQCLCGLCTLSCANEGCRAGAPGSECIQTDHFAHAGLCAGRVSEPICLSSCSAETGCGTEHACVEGICLPASTAAIARAARDRSAASSLCATNPVVSRSLHVDNQAQLDALTGCERIEGALTLELFPGANTASLAPLQVITGVLTVRANSEESREPMPIFAALEVLGGLSLSGLRIEGPPALPRLGAIQSGSRFDVRRGGLSISDCEGFIDLGVFAALEELNFLTISDTPGITSFRGLSGLRRLRRVEAEGSALASLEGLAQVSGLQSLTIRRTNIESLEGLGAHRELLALSLEDNDRLSNVRGLGLPESLNGLHISDNDRLQTVEGFEALRRVGAIELINNAVLSTTTGLDGLEQAEGVLLIDNPMLASLEGLAGLREVRQLRISGNPALERLEGLARLEAVEALLLENDTALQSLVGLGPASLGTLDVRSTALRDLTGLEQITGLQHIVFQDNPALTSLAGLPVPLATAYVEITHSPTLVDLGGLREVTVLDRLELNGLGISDLDALQNLLELSVLHVADNAHLLQADALAGLSGLRELIVLDNPRLERLPEFGRAFRSADPTRGVFPAADFGIFSADISRNSGLVEGPAFPTLDLAAQITVMDNPSLARLIGFSALRRLDTLTVQNNAALAELSFPALERADALVVRGHPLLSEQSLAFLDEVSVREQKKIASGSGRNPCPWIDDQYCDEQFSECAPGTDALDCAALDARSSDPEQP